MFNLHVLRKHGVSPKPGVLFRAATFAVSSLLAWQSFAGTELTQAGRHADALLRRMTVEEKIGQLVLQSGFGATTGPMQEQEALEECIRTGACGNVFNVLTVTQICRLQKIATEHTRLRIPLLFGYDVIHGYKTIFPIPLGEAASWNLETIERSARIAAIEAAAAGLNWTFAPMVDIARDPRWGRISEGAGEDPFLGSAIAGARVRGFQGANLADPDAVLACVKHFAAYGAAQAGRDYFTVDMSERVLREVYLPPYRAAIDAGALSVMTSFNELDGTPATANRFLLGQVLRDEWGFKGFVVTDYTSINEMVAHGSAADEIEAGRQSLAAGVDMDMQGSVYRRYLQKLMADRQISEKQINAAARRVLQLKFLLGLFDDPFRHCDEEREARLLGDPAHFEAARQAACESFVLLKNEAQLLPLKRGVNIAVVGPLAEAKRDLLGSWKGEGDPEQVETVVAALTRENAGGVVAFSQGCEVNSTNRANFDAAVAAVQKADVAVLVVGESWNLSGEAASRTSIGLPGVQTDLLRAIKQTGKPVIVVLMNGRPLALETESQLAAAMLVAWFPGTRGAQAIADALFGRHNPGGKLPVTFPRNLGQVPIFYSVKNTGRPVDPTNLTEPYKSSYLDCPNDPLYPFGFGLSYTTFSYSDIEVDGATMKPGTGLTAAVTVTNTGQREGVEVVQLYIRDLVGSVTRPLLELKGFQRIALKAGESRKVTFAITKAELSFLRRDLTWGAEPGDFQVFIGPNSRDLKTAKFTLLAK